MAKRKDIVDVRMQSCVTKAEENAIVEATSGRDEHIVMDQGRDHREAGMSKEHLEELEGLAERMAEKHAFKRPTHYLVLKDGPLRRILSGEKRSESRDVRLAACLAHEEVALACSRSSKSPMAGKVVAWVLFGHVEWDEESGRSNVAIRRVHTLEEWEWEDVPGGLGLRPF